MEIVLDKLGQQISRVVLCFVTVGYRWYVHCEDSLVVFVG